MGLCREKIDWVAHHYKGWVTVFAFMIFLVTGCGEQGLTIDAEKSIPQENVLHQADISSDSVQYYFDQARLGIGDAYVKMALYHLDGTLGKPNLLNVMTMGLMADEYMEIPNINALFKDVPDSDVTKIAYQSLDMINHTENEDSILAKAKELLDMGISEGFLMQAVLSWKNGDKDIIVAGEEYGSDFKPETLLKIADRFPMAYRFLGDYYAKIPNDSVSDIPLARQYYLKASDHACLGRREALWVLETIYVKGYPAVDSLTDKRLWSLGRNEINDSVIWLP